MTTKVLTGGYAAGFDLAAPITRLDIAATGHVGGPGIISGSLATYTVNNSGAVQAVGASSDSALVLNAGGWVENNASGLLQGQDYGVAVLQTTGVVDNFGSILSTGTAGGKYGEYSGAYLAHGGEVVNGNASTLSATIIGQTGVYVGWKPGTVTNFGLIESSATRASSYSAGVILGDGGSLTNGSPTDLTATISGSFGVYLKSAPGTVRNFGTITSNLYAVYLVHGGAVVNGSATDTGAYIEGKFRSIALKTKTPGKVLNYGTLNSVSLYGSFTNGDEKDLSAQVKGELYLGSSSKATNFGTIDSANTIFDAGVNLITEIDAEPNLAAPSSITNGSASDAAAFIAGLEGIDGVGTVTNFGTVMGIGGPAIDLVHGTEASELVAERGSMVEGAVYCNLVDVPSGVAIFAGDLQQFSMLEGAGTAKFTEDKSEFSNSSANTIASIEIDGPSAGIDIKTSQAYTGRWDQISGTLSCVYQGDRFTLTGSANSLAGTIAGAGTIVLSDGKDNLQNISVSVGQLMVDNAVVTLSGAIDITTSLRISSPHIVVAAAGATLSGTGTIGLSNLATNEITGASAAATLTNVSNEITGAGLLGGGKMTLINQAGGTIYGNQATALTIDTGTATIANAGIIENTGAGGTIVKSAVNNTGTLEAIAGTITFDGAVTGAGTVRITAGTADFASTFSENVTFAAASKGTLELAKSQTDAGSISGFSKTAATALDLGDIAFISGTTKATFSGTTASGVLTVTDGTHTAKITLTGDYVGGAFVTKTDGHGGTIVIDTAGTAARSPTASPAAPTAPFVGAMAGFGAKGAGSAIAVTGAIAAERPMLVRPHGAIA